MSALSETAKLVSSLELKDNFTPAANRAMKSLGKMESTGFRVGQNIGKGINNAARNLKRIAEVGIVGLAGAIAYGAKSLGDLARTQEQTNAVISSTKGAAGESAAEIRKMALALEDVTTVDDKVIQDGENMLLTFTGIGKKVFPEATKAALNMAVAMAGGNVEAVDLKASSIQLGKALNDPIKGITALSKVGVSFTEKQKKQIKAAVKAGDTFKAQKIILAELNKEFGKAGEAAGKGPEATMRRLKDAGEDLSQILARGVLPVIERFARFLTTKLNDPAFLAAVDDFGRKLGDAGGKFLDFLEKVDFTAIGNALKVGAGFAGQIIDAFLNAPTWLQEAIVTGWGLNKLTGGAVSDIFGTLASGLIKGVLGMNAGVVHLTAGTVVGGGGGLPVSPAGGGSWTALFGLIGPAAAAAIGTYLVTQEANTSLHSKGITQSFDVPGAGVLPFGIDTSIKNLITAINILTTHKPDRVNLPTGGPHDESLAHTSKAITDRVDKTTTAVETMKGNIAKDLDGNKAAIEAAGSVTGRAATAAGATAAIASSGAGTRVVSAIWAARPIVNTYVNVSSTTVQQKNVVIRRAGPASGDRNQHGPTEFDN